MMTQGRRVRTGKYFKSGNWAATEGALSGGVERYYGYPITPSSEIAEFMSSRLPQVGGEFYQMEDEIASIVACLGAAWGGKKSMTATSGPGFSLMQETIGLAVITETPVVIVDSMRVGPSTGMPTYPAQGDLLQARFGSHGDYSLVVLAPNSVQEAYDIMIDSFVIAEQLRTPVIVLLDQILSTMKESVTIPTEDDVTARIRELKQQINPPSSLVPPMKFFGTGNRVFNTGLTHNLLGFPDMDTQKHIQLIERIFKKLDTYKDKFPPTELYQMDDAEMALVSYGSTSRVTYEVVDVLREKGFKIGSIRLRTLWPFPNHVFEPFKDQIHTYIVPELSKGQLIWPVKFYVRDAQIFSYTKIGGVPIYASELVRYIEKNVNVQTIMA